MNIHLKQAEIIIALKQYITQQGINVEGKAINIVFTSGRKNTGLTAAPTLTVVPAQLPEKKAEVEVPEAQEETLQDFEVVVPVQEPEEETNKPKTVSLFN